MDELEQISAVLGMSEEDAKELLRDVDASASNVRKMAVQALCKKALKTCDSINTNLIGLQSRLELDMPVTATARIIEKDMQTLNERIENLHKVIVGDWAVE